MYRRGLRRLPLRGRVMEHLRDGRLVPGVVMRTRLGGKRVTVAFLDPEFRGVDGRRRRIRRLSIARGRIWTAEEI